MDAAVEVDGADSRLQLRRRMRQQRRVNPADNLVRRPIAKPSSVFKRGSTNF
jgi:hypothetical protein